MSIAVQDRLLDVPELRDCALPKLEAVELIRDYLLFPLGTSGEAGIERIVFPEKHAPAE